MTFAADNDDESQSGSRPTAHAHQHATTILNKSFLLDKTVDMTANFLQMEDEIDEKENLNKSQNNMNILPAESDT